MRAIVFFSLILWIVGCSDDSDGIDGGLPQHVVAVSEIGFDVDVAMIDTRTKEVSISDYSEQFIDARGRKYLNYFQDAVTYIYYEFPRIELWRLDFTTGSITTGIIYEIDGNQYVFDTTSDGENAYLIVDTYLDIDRVERKVVITDLSDMSIRATIPVTQTNTSQFGSSYLYKFEDQLLVYSNDQRLDTKIYKIFPDEVIVTDSLLLEEETAIVVDDELLYSISSNGTYKRYEITSLDEDSKGTFNYEYVAQSGGFNSNLVSEGVIVVDLPYAQPFPINSSPAKVSLSSGNILSKEPYFLHDLIETFKAQLGYDLSITTYNVDFSRDIIVFGYESFQQTSLADAGGLLYATFEGDYLDHQELDLIPTAIIIR